MVDLNIKLAACPCGKVPTAIVIMDSGQGEKWASAVPNCCGMWMIEFRTKYLDQATAECIRLAEDAWNAAPREQLTEIETLQKKVMPPVPEGMQLVPIDPTEAMIEACFDLVRCEWTDPKRHFVSHYKAMVAAAKKG